MGNGNIDVGNNPTRNPGEPIVERLAEVNGSTEPRKDGRKPPKPKWPRNCGAMSEQRGDGGRGNESVPQELVQLVGFREPKARPAPLVRPRLSSGKR